MDYTREELKRFMTTHPRSGHDIQRYWYEKPITEAQIEAAIDYLEFALDALMFAIEDAREQARDYTASVQLDHRKYMVGIAEDTSCFPDDVNEFGFACGEMACFNDDPVEILDYQQICPAVLIDAAAVYAFSEEDLFGSACPELLANAFEHICYNLGDAFTCNPDTPYTCYPYAGTEQTDGTVAFERKGETHYYYDCPQSDYSLVCGITASCGRQL